MIAKFSLFSKQMFDADDDTYVNYIRPVSKFTKSTKVHPHRYRNTPDIMLINIVWS